MELMDAITKRRSIRQYDKNHPVDEDTVSRILEAAILAPSAGNGQSWHFEVVRDPNLKHRLATESGHQHFLEQAPVTIIVCANVEQAEKGYGLRGRNTYALQETAAAIQNMMLVVTSLGLGSCWVGAFDEQIAADILDLPKNLRPVAMVPIGKPAEPAKRVPPRKKIEDVTVFR